jgi:hypothetical protein
MRRPYRGAGRTALGLAALVGALTGEAAAQGPAEPPGWVYNDLACAPQLTIVPPTRTLRVIGSQDTVERHMLGPGDTLVISGGSMTGLAPGQQYYVRRLANTFGAPPPSKAHPASVHTAGWVRIAGVDGNVATATVVHACEGILLNDYLEPFTAPVATPVSTGNAVQYENMGRILAGDEGRDIAARNDLMSIDRGASSGVVVGQRYRVFRDKRENAINYSKMQDPATEATPLVEIGEVVVIAVQQEHATVQVLKTRDAIRTGDIVFAVQ